MTGAGPPYQERQWCRIQYKECREEMALGPLIGHIHTQHGREAERRRRWESTAPGE